MDTAIVYDADPLEAARRWVAAGASWLHVVDLDGALAGTRTRHWDIAAAIARQTGVPVQVGGGIRSHDDALGLLESGISRIVIGTLAATDPAALEPLLRAQADRIAIGLDARDGIVQIRGWGASGGRRAVELAVELRARGARRFVYTDIARDGTLAGPDLESTRELARAVSVPITASGGVASLDDLRALRALELAGVDSVIVGKALYEGRFTLQDALEACA
jgi:phosphoribosylformimino-5-aminoimidazole carboxamide ribotide isomerase